MPELSLDEIYEPYPSDEDFENWREAEDYENERPEDDDSEPGETCEHTSIAGPYPPDRDIGINERHWECSICGSVLFADEED